MNVELVRKERFIMTIKDIARLAQVSVSTVSKVLNNKDENITEETRKRVLDVARQYQFTPYKNIRDQLSVSSHTIALIVPDVASPFFSGLITAIEQEVRALGYCLMLLNSKGSPDEEYDLLLIVMQKQVDGLIFYPITQCEGGVAERTLSLLRELKKPYVFADLMREPGAYQTRFDFRQAAFAATKYLTDKMHRKIALFCDGDLLDNRFLDGYRKALYQASISFDEKLCVHFMQRDEGFLKLAQLFDVGTTAVICAGSRSAPLLYQYASRCKCPVPEQCSVLLLDDSCHLEGFLPQLTHVEYPYEEFAKSITKQLNALIYKSSDVEESRTVNTAVAEGASVATPYGSRGKRSIIVGDLSIDVTLYASYLPAVNCVSVVNKKSITVGGRAANQAICASQLGCNISVLGCVGNDREGHLIYENLTKHRVDVDGIRMDKTNATGCAYISVAQNGDNLVLVHAGANDALSAQQILKHRELFTDARFCSCHTAIPQDALAEVFRQCAEKQIDMILKPNNFLPAEYEAEWLDGLFLLLPNESEIAMLRPELETLEERIYAYRAKGVRNIIVTLAERGCAFLAEGCDRIRYYPTEQVEVVDATGASDCFIAALMTCLSDRADFDYAIKYANFAASLSVTRSGNISSADYKSMLDLHFGAIL